MKLLSPKNAVVLAVCLGYLPHPARSIPVAPETAIAACRDNSTSLEGCPLTKAEERVRRDKTVVNLELRTWRLPRPKGDPSPEEPAEPITAPRPTFGADPPPPNRDPPPPPPNRDPPPPPPNRDPPRPPPQKGPGPKKPNPFRQHPGGDHDPAHPGPGPKKPNPFRQHPGGDRDPAHPGPAHPPQQHQEPQPGDPENPKQIQLPPRDPAFHGKPETANPGQDDGFGIPKDINEYQDLGRSQMTAYRRAIEDHRPDTLILATKEEVRQHPEGRAFRDYSKIAGYRTDIETPGDIRTSSMQAVWNFKESDIGFNIRDTEFVKDVTVRRRGNTDGSTITEGAFDPEGKFMVYKNTFKKQNDDVTDHIPLNEIAMQNFLRVAGENSKNLRAAFITNIKNKGFYNIIRRNDFDYEQTFEKVVSFEAGSEEFNRIIGSDNVFSKIFSFRNHHYALDNKEIEKIVVVPRQAPGSDEELSIAIVFADKKAG